METTVYTKVIDEKGNFTKDYSFLRENKYIKDNIVLLGLGGSHAYGTNVETSDIDVRGIAARNKDDILLGRDFEQVVNEKTDTTIYSLDKAFHLFTQCNPNMIEMLGLRKQDYFYVSEIGKKILENKDLFLSQKCVNTFGGYATQQLYRIQQKSLSVIPEREYKEHIKKVLEGMANHLEGRYGLSSEQVKPIISDDNRLLLDIHADGVDAEDLSGILGEINTTINDYYKPSKRNNRAFEHGKIAKHSMHLIRLYLMVIDLLLDGEINTYREKEHDFLMSIREGKYLDETGKPSQEFFEIVKDYEDKFNKAKEATILPLEPDYNKINALRKEINEKIITG